MTWVSARLELSGKGNVTCSRGGKSCLQVFFLTVSGAMSTTSTLAVIHGIATMGLPITGLVRPVGVSVLTMNVAMSPNVYS